MKLEEYRKHKWTLSKQNGILGYACIDCDVFISQEEHIRLRKEIKED